MSIDLLSTNYSNFDEIPYLNGGKDVASEYVSDIDTLKQHIKNNNNYLDSSNIQDSLKKYYDDGHHDTLNLDGLEDYIANAFVENENLSKNELKNKMDYAVKTENLHKSIENSKLYNSALQKMVTEDISLDKIGIEKVKNSLNNKSRSLEIRQYYDGKMGLQIGIIKTWIIMCLVLLALTFLYKINLLNTNVYISLIGLGLACIFIYAIGSVIDILIRDNVKIDEYAYIRSHHYLNKRRGDAYKTVDDVPLHQQEDLISNKCLQEYNKQKATEDET